ncbi:hypothetical protein Tco_0520542 [Tanacetum coccineum]
MNLPDHRIKLWWKWRYLVPVESIHSPMLTLNVFNQRHHDNQKTYNTASATLISNVMIKKSVSMPVRKSQRHMKVLSLDFQVILFGTIPTTISPTTPTIDSPIIHDDTLLIPTDTPTISPIVPTIPPIAPAIQYTSPFICTDSSDSDTPDTPPSQDPYEVTVARGGAE